MFAHYKSNFYSKLPFIQVCVIETSPKIIKFLNFLWEISASNAKRKANVEAFVQVEVRNFLGEKYIRRVKMHDGVKCENSKDQKDELVTILFNFFIRCWRWDDNPKHQPEFMFRLSFWRSTHFSQYLGRI